MTNGKVSRQSVGIMAAIIGAIAILPLLHRVTFKRYTKCIGYLWLGLRLLTSVLWLYYGLSNRLLPNIIAGSIATIAFIYLIILKAWYEKTGRNREKTEKNETKDKNGKYIDNV